MSGRMRGEEADEFLEKVEDTYQKVQDLISGKTSVLESLQQQEEEERLEKIKEEIREREEQEKLRKGRKGKGYQ